MRGWLATRGVLDDVHAVIVLYQCKFRRDRQFRIILYGEGKRCFHAAWQCDNTQRGAVRCVAWVAIISRTSREVVFSQLIRENASFVQ